jgi:hypothetical protein
VPYAFVHQIPLVLDECKKNLTVIEKVPFGDEMLTIVEDFTLRASTKKALRIGE